MIRFGLVALVIILSAPAEADILFPDGNVWEIFINQDFNANLAEARNGNARAQYLVARALLFGNENIGVEANQEKGLFWMKAAAGQDVAEAYYALGIMYRKGIGVDKDPKAWEKLTAMAGEQQLLSAMADLVAAYRYGLPELGIASDQEQYLYWLEKTAKSGQPFSMVNMAITYRQGLGVEKDLDKAFEWLKRAAEQDDLSALGMMGEYYEKGMVVEQDFVTAYMMYDLSGSTPNKKRDNIAEKMTEAQIREAIARSWQWQVERESYRPTSKGYRYRYPLEEVD